MTLFLSVALAIVGIASAQSGEGAATTHSFWAATDKPAAMTSSDTKTVELGVRFTSSQPGTVTAIKFFKRAGNAAPHKASIWNSAGRRLATVKFTKETKAGWQRARLATPVKVTPGTAYVVSYTSKGLYPADHDYFAGKTRTSGPLTAIAGVYDYNLGFPTQTYRGSNYYVDLVFKPGTSAPPPSSSSTSHSTTTTTTSLPTSSPTPSSSETEASSCASFPDSSCTGWRHTGVTLRTVAAGQTGPGWKVENNTFYVTKPGTVVDALDIPFCAKILADDVTIKRSRIGCASYYTVNVSDPPRYFERFTMTDVELDGLGSRAVPGIAVMASPRATFTRLDVHGFGSSGPRLGTGSILQDSYIHDFVCAPTWHSAGTSANDGGSNIVVRNNNLVGRR